MSKIKLTVWVVILVALVYCYSNINSKVISVKQGSNYILTTLTDNPVYVNTSDNQLVCDKATVSNIVINLISSGYEVVQSYMDNKALDIILSDGSVTYRIYYTDNKNLHVLGSPYEKTRGVLAYISEKKSR